jgi:BolA family transcriptional regulator, general stress-responsive regulator
MSVQDQISSCLVALQPLHLEIINESHKHSGPGSETHFKVVAVSTVFAEQNRLARHRQVNALLTDLIGNPIHALSLLLYTPEEWAERSGNVLASPPCRGGSK